jgi:hypothetical protein
MLQGFGIVRQIGVNDQVETRQVDPAGRDVGGYADAGAAIAQGLQGVIAFFLAEFTGEGDGREAALQQRRMQTAHTFAGVAEHQGAR